MSLKRIAKSSIFYWITIVIFSLSISIFNLYISVSKAEFAPGGGDIHNIIQMIQKYDDPNLFSRDFAFSDNGYKLYVPAYIQLIRLINVIVGKPGYEYAVQYLMLPISLLFLLTMTWLVKRLTGLRWASFVIAFISTLFIEVIFGGYTYSIGTFVTPRYLHLAIAPLLLGLLLFYGRDKEWSPYVFLLAGLSCNLQFGSGVGLISGVWIAHIAYEYINRKINMDRILHWAKAVIFSLIGAAPYFWAYLSGQTTSKAPIADVTPSVFNSMVNFRLTFYPMGVYEYLGLPSWMLYCIKAFFYMYPVLVLAGILLTRFNKITRTSYHVLFALNIIFIAIVTFQKSLLFITLTILPVILFGIYDIFFKKEIDEKRYMMLYLVPGFSILGALFSMWILDICSIFNIYIPSFYFDFGITIKYIPLITYIYGALLISEIIILLKRNSAVKTQLGKRVVAQSLLAAIVLCFVIKFAVTPGNGFKYYYTNMRTILNGQSTFVPSKTQVDYREATSWIKNKTLKDDLFLVLTKDPSYDFMFRYKAQRSMWVCKKDGGMNFYKGRSGFIYWYNEYIQREKVVKEKNINTLEKYSDSKKIDYIFVDKKNFNWINDNVNIKGLHKVYENGSYLLLKVSL